jgi:hypothetical protein
MQGIDWRLHDYTNRAGQMNISVVNPINTSLDDNLRAHWKDQWRFREMFGHGKTPHPSGPTRFSGSPKRQRKPLPRILMQQKPQIRRGPMRG